MRQRLRMAGAFRGSGLQNTGEGVPPPVHTLRRLSGLISPIEALPCPVDGPLTGKGVLQRQTIQLAAEQVAGVAAI